MTNPVSPRLQQTLVGGAVLLLALGLAWGATDISGQAGYADYMNRGHSTLNRYIMQVAAGSSYFYDSTTYAYCVN